VVVMSQQVAACHEVCQDAIMCKRGCLAGDESV
jgi:hypothetical protein